METSQRSETWEIQFDKQAILKIARRRPKTKLAANTHTHPRVRITLPDDQGFDPPH